MVSRMPWRQTTPDPTNDQRWDPWTLKTREVWYQARLKARDPPGTPASTDKNKYNAEFYSDVQTRIMAEYMTGKRWHAANASYRYYDAFYSMPYDPAEALVPENMQSPARLRWARLRMYVIRRRVVRYWQLTVACSMACKLAGERARKRMRLEVDGARAMVAAQ